METIIDIGWSPCFVGSIGVCARKMETTLPADTAIDDEVDLCNKKGHYFLQALLNVSVPGLDKELAQLLKDYTELTCPYSRAFRNHAGAEVFLFE